MAENDHKLILPLAEGATVDGLAWVYSANGIPYCLKFDKDVYAAYLEQQGIEAGPPLDKTDWPVEMSLEQYECLNERGALIALTYFAVAERTGRIKIGKSRQINQRAYALSREQGERIKMVATLRGDIFERIYHDAFAQHRIEGEWFSPHPDILAEIKGLRTACKPNPAIKCPVRQGGV